MPIEMLRLARYYGNCPQQKKMLDYVICSYMLRGDAERFLIATKAFDIYKDKYQRKAKLVRHLLSRGFETELVVDAVDAYLSINSL